MKLNLGITYILKTLWFYRSRILLILFGLIFALGLLFANIIWEQTSEELVLEEFNDNIDYLATTSTFSFGKVFALIDFLESEPLVSNFDLSVQSNAIFNSFNKNGSYRYYPLGTQQNLSDPVDVISSISTNLEGMKRLENILNIVGDIPRKSDQMMLSVQAKLELENTYNITVNPGTTIDVEIARRFPETDRGEALLRHFESKKFPNMTITGIFERNGAVAIADEAYSPNVFNNLVIFPITQQNFNFTDLDLMDRYGLILRQMINFDFDTMVKVGIDQLDLLLYQFMERIKSRYWFAVGDLLIDAVQELQVNYEFSFHSVLYYYPLILLSLLLSHYGIGQLINERKTLISLLRIKGANDTDLVKLYYIEYIVIAAFSLLFGIPTAVLLAALIPAFQNDFSIDLNITTQFLNNLSFEVAGAFELAVFTFTFYFLSVTYHIIINIFFSDNDTQYQRYVNLVRFILTLVLSVLLYLITSNLNIPLNPTSFNLNKLPNLRDAIFYLLVLWLLYAQYLTDFSIWLLRKIASVGSVVSPKFSFYLSRSIRRKRNQNKLIVFYLIFMFSMLLFSSSLYATYDSYDNKSEEFLQGAPLRIHTTGTYANFTDSLLSVDGIEAVTPILSTIIYLGPTAYTLYGIDAASYYDIGNWQYAEGLGKPKYLLDQISDSTRNILIPQSVIEYLGFEINNSLNVFGLLGNYISTFNISGVLNSAPGLGLAGNSNPEVSQNTNGWLMTSIEYIQQNFKDTFTTLFLATMKPNASYNQVKQNLEQMDNVLIVNPKPINQNFIGSFITTYLPKTKAILIFVTLITTLISLVMISLSTEYLINERKDEFALLVATGATRQFVLNLVVIEFIVFMILSIIVGSIYGIVLAFFALKYFIPFTLRKIFIPITFEIDILPIFILMLIEIGVVLLIIKGKESRVLPKNISEILMEKDVL